ncbi:MAG TPA: protein kinase [Microbacteriaceae bacterium]|nr:protein kinase [Microbacteriaceae bacterium]
MRPSAGITFGGRYELQSRIAIGGMGEVWQATDLIIGRQVAIKILKDEYLGDPGFLERFRAEARHAALVNHEGIANVYDYGEEDGSAYLVMELVPGEALSTILEREKSLDPDRVLDIIAQTAAALYAAHQAGLVHRDIKPGNLLITPDGRVKITDFGIARIADQVPLTATGQVMGTVQYLSPEQASGQAASAATDIYSIGIVAYEALAGKRPFSGESQVAIAMAQINDTPPDLPDSISEPIRNLVSTCIAKNPANRPSSAQALATAAKALRRGDVAAAALAVPTVLSGGATPTQATTVFPVAAGDDAATTVLPMQAGATPTAPTSRAEVREESKRNPLTWPLIALAALVILIATGTIWAVVGANSGGSAGPSSTVSTPTKTPSKTPSASATPSPNTVMVTKADLAGMNVDEAAKKLVDLKLVAKKVEGGKLATSAAQLNTVYDVTPEGALAFGTEVTLTYYGKILELSAPANPPILSTTTPAPNTDVRVDWGAQSCPAGLTLKSYTLDVTGSASVPNSSSFGPGTTNAIIRVGSNAGGTFAVRFNYTCDELTSPWSSSTNGTVQ